MPSRSRRSLGYLVILLIFLFTGAAVRSEAPVGRVERLEGRLTLRRGMEQRLIGSGELLFAGDRLIMGSSGQAVIALAESRIRLGPEATLLLAEADQTANRYGLFLWLGRIWLFVQGGDGLDFRVETPAAVAGVRGTVFSVEVALDGATWIGVNEGRVLINTPNGGKLVLDPGYGTKIVPGGTPGNPTAMAASDIGGLDLKNDGNGNGRDGNGGGHGRP